MPFVLVEKLTDATFSVLSVNADVVVVVHSREGGVWARVLPCHYSEISRNLLKIISKAEILLGKDVKVQSSVLGSICVVMKLQLLKSIF